jgi:signal transduction histidine kinase
LLGGLMLAAFIPLFYAVATYTSYTLKDIRETNARGLGRAVAAHVAEARSRRLPNELLPLLDASVSGEGVVAIGVYDRAGKPLVRSGEPSLVAQLSGPVDVRHESLFTVHGANGRALAVVVPDPLGAVVAVLRTDDDSARAGPLVRLVGLYTGLMALGLLVLAYFALTRLIVRPLDALARAAERVAGGARQLAIPRVGARELEQLGISLDTMTAHLINEEEALKKQIAEVRLTTERLKEAQERLIRSERLASVGRLAAGLAHEIGNPISALIGLGDLLLAGGLSEAEQRDFLQRIRNETERINRILRDLLQFARPAGTGDEAASEPGDIDTAARDTAALVRPQKSMKDMELALDVETDLPRVSLGQDELVQVILNLVLNAADACEGKGKVTLTARRGGLGVAITVEDSGPGVAPELHDRLFEPFVSTKDVGAGTGLGLAVCRGLVEAAGGTIALDPSTPRGARFVIELPTKDSGAA